MGQPVKLSDALVQDARLVGNLTERSIAGQIEFWAGLGKAIELLLRLPEALALRKNGQARTIEECLAEVGTPAGTEQLRKVLEARPFPHFEGVPGRPELLEQIEADGTRTVGQFVGREFVAAEPE